MILSRTCQQCSIRNTSRKTKVIRVTPRHVRNGVFRHCNHLNDVGLEDVQGAIQVSVQEIFVHTLLRRIVDEDVDGAVSA